jgi:hypothetical protein
MTNSLLVF